MVKTIVAQRKWDCEHLLGQFLDESHYDVLLDEDVDVYRLPSLAFEGDGPSEDECLLKFRKNVFSAELQKSAHDGLIGAAIQTNNRGLAAGNEQAERPQGEWVTPRQAAIMKAIAKAAPTIEGGTSADQHIEHPMSIHGSDEDHDGSLWLVNNIKRHAHSDRADSIKWFDDFLKSLKPLNLEQRKDSLKEFQKKYISTTKYANPVLSGIAGYMDRYPRTPFARPASYTRDNPDKFALSFPYLQELDSKFKELLPQRYAAQRSAADAIDPHFLVADTVFTTITVNENFRTAAHRDAGDLNAGFSNLGVVSSGENYKGAYLVLPEYRVAVNIRPGDLLLVNNHECIHGNTPLAPENPQRAAMMSRMSIVAYFRENLKAVGSWEFEECRRKFIDSCRFDASHPYQREHWNGVYPGWEQSAEWFNYLKSQPKGAEWIAKYYGTKNEPSDLSELFE